MNNNRKADKQAKWEQKEQKKKMKLRIVCLCIAVVMVITLFSSIVYTLAA